MKTIALIGNSALSMVKFRSHLMKALIASGYKVYVICPSDEFVEDLKHLKVEWIDWSFSRDSRNPFKEIGVVLDLLKTMLSVQPSFCIFFTIKPNLYGSLVAKVLKIPCIVVNTGLGYVFINDTSFTRFTRRLCKLTYGWAKKIIFLNEHDLKTFLEYGLIEADKATVIPGEGVDSEYFSPIQSFTQKRFSYVGRILWDKGFAEYVEAAKKIKSEYPEYEFHVIGKIGFGNPSDVSLNYIQKNSKDGVIIHQEFTKDVRQFLASSKFLVLPSYREGVPMTVLEAACMEVPSIVSDAPGCIETVKDEVTGYICKVKSVESLTNVLLKAISIPDTDYKKMGKEAREFVISKFEVKQVLQSYKKIFQELGMNFRE